jgi:hypothetical protein
MFETFNTPAFYVSIQAVLSLYASAAPSMETAYTRLNSMHAAFPHRHLPDASALSSAALLSIPCWPRRYCSSQQVLTLHHLTTLKLVAYAIVKWDDLLRLLVAPSLTSLVILGAQIPLEVFTLLMSRSNCSLLTLTLQTNDSPLNNNNLGLFIECLATVTVLNTIPWIIPALLVRQIHKGVLPPLQHGTFSVQPSGLDAARPNR